MNKMVTKNNLTKLLGLKPKIPVISPKEERLLALSYEVVCLSNRKNRIEEYAKRRNNVHYDNQTMVKPPVNFPITRKPIQHLTQEQIEIQRINSGRKYQHRSPFSKIA